MGMVVHSQANGVLAYFTTLALFVLGWQLKVFSPARVYDLFGEILSGLNVFSLLFCLFLYFKVSSPMPDSLMLFCTVLQSDTD